VTIEELLNTAKERGASDLHVTVGIPPKIRVNGELTDMDYPRMLPQDVEAVIKPTMSEKVKQAFREKGEIDYAYSISGLGRYRVNVFRQRGSIAFVMRLVGTAVPQAAALGVPDSVVELTGKKRGLVLVTGPTGSGKSTTLASLIDTINSNYNSHIITLEDPIEYLHNHKKSVVNQREIGLDTQGYARALRSALREDPDVILVGEMRDLDTISTAITAAETGPPDLQRLQRRKPGIWSFPRCIPSARQIRSTALSMFSRRTSNSRSAYSLQVFWRRLFPSS